MTTPGRTARPGGGVRPEELRDRLPATSGADAPAAESVSPRARAQPASAQRGPPLASAVRTSHTERGTVTTESTTEPAAVAASVQSSADVTFGDFGVRPEIVEALADSGITHPFPIQAMTLPVAMQGHDIIGQAKTGTGKTLGFGVPLLHRVVAPGEEGYDTLPFAGKPQALVVLPTRELAVQVANDLATASRKRSVRIVVLDEADEMLDLGFLPDVETLLSRTPANRHTMLFSATMPGAVVAMARRYMSHPTHIRAADPDDEGLTKKDIKQVVYRAHALDKVEVLARILQSEGRGRTIVFARTKRTAAKVADELVDRGFAAGSLHGDLGQGAREQALRAFRNNKVDVLVATDVAARGIDVDDVTHVVNYQCPEDEKTYLHRTGRTGRAGNKGTAVTFVDWDDVPRWSLIDKALGLGVPEPVETYSSSPHLYADLNIPEGTKGRLPKSKQVLEGLAGEVLEDLGETGKRGGKPAGAGRDGGRGERRDGGRGRGGGRGERRDGGRGRGDGRAERAGGAAANRASDENRAPREDGEKAEGGQRRRSRGGRRRTRGGSPVEGQAPATEA